MRDFYGNENLTKDRVIDALRAAAIKTARRDLTDEQAVAAAQAMRKQFPQGPRDFEVRDFATRVSALNCGAFDGLSPSHRFQFGWVAVAFDLDS